MKPDFMIPYRGKRRASRKSLPGGISCYSRPSEMNHEYCASVSKTILSVFALFNDTHNS